MMMYIAYGAVATSSSISPYSGHSSPNSVMSIVTFPPLVVAKPSRAAKNTPKATSSVRTMNAVRRLSDMMMKLMQQPTRWLQSALFGLQGGIER